MNPIIKDFLDNGYIDEDGAERLMQKEANWAELAKGLGAKLLTSVIPTMGGVALGNMAYKYFGEKELVERDEKNMQEVAQSYNNMMSSYPELRKNQYEVSRRFQEIASLSPTAAKSPVVAKKIIQRTLRKGLDDKDMSNLLRLEVNSRQLQNRPIPKTMMGEFSRDVLKGTGSEISKAFGAIQGPAVGSAPASMPSSSAQQGPSSNPFQGYNIALFGGVSPEDKQGQALNLNKLWYVLKNRNALPPGAPTDVSMQSGHDNWMRYLASYADDSDHMGDKLNILYEKAGLKSGPELYRAMEEVGQEKKAAALGLQYALIKSANTKTKLDLTKTLLGLGAASLFGGAIGVAEEAADYARTKRLNNKINNSWEKTRGNLKRMTEEGNRLSSEIDYRDRKTQQKAQETFNVLADVAPNIAANSTLATSFVNNVMLNEGQFSHEFVKSLAETQKNIATMNEYRSPFADSPISSGFAKGFGGAGGTEIIKSYAQDVIKGD
jgi:hypothetical protein